MNQEQKNRPSKEPTMTIVGETVNYLLANQAHKMTKRRKVLTINTANKLKQLFLNKDATINVKTKLLKSYITPIFLYNSVLWTLTNNMQRKVCSFQRQIIRTFVWNV